MINIRQARRAGVKVAVRDYQKLFAAIDLDLKEKKGKIEEGETFDQEHDSLWI